MPRVDLDLEFVDRAGRPLPNRHFAIASASEAVPEIGYRTDVGGRISMSLPPGPVVLSFEARSGARIPVDLVIAASDQGLGRRIEIDDDH